MRPCVKKRKKWIKKNKEGKKEIGKKERNSD
jgi:hypothetical protein